MNIMKLLPAFAVTAALLPFAATSAQAAIRTGTLTCDISGGVGYILASSKAVSCRFTDFSGNTEHYSGDVRKFGVDIGVTYAGRVVWAVFEPAIRQGSLAGTYNGVSAEATAGIGLGANVLVGGGNGGVTLQPISVQGQTGLNVAAGIGSLNIALAETPAAVHPMVTVHHHHHHHHHFQAQHRHYHHSSVHHHHKPIHHHYKAK
jgi:hypothetical protein